ncbi:ankyrin repeat-containing domain protein [Massariosphaeria phaeospora]|uniref:Ankyrin repeat-containing domain protein n=1 Tax=Massariosphaeria phaeospora TaxID=100035 RepID=A0A7C8I803_9PLEO|nr:ankyrin repeat-containing domain protein [Massariosphaeria phaeospora]
MHSPQTPPPPPLPGTHLLPPYARPEQVDLCYRAACNGDLDGVKEQVRQLFHNPEVAYVGERPQPGWLYDSLLTAIQRNDAEMVQFLLDENVTDGYLPVEPAVRARAFEVLEQFLRNGLDINQPFRRNEPPVLSIPICTSDKEMVTWLLDHGANPNSPCSEWDFTPVSIAMYPAPIETINYLFQRGANPLNGELLQWAVIRNEPNGLDLVRHIVEKGAPIDEIKYANDPKSYYQREPFGLGTPLHRAAEDGKVDIVGDGR